MQSIVSKGKNVKEAVRLGLELLNVKMDDVNIEIIREESKGFLGMGSKRAIVKLSKENAKTQISQNPIDSIEKMLDQKDMEQSETEVLINHLKEDTDATLERQRADEGKAWVKDGQLFCKTSAKQYPTVTFTEGIQLVKNNQVVKSPAIISEKDQYEIKALTEEKETKWKVGMSADKLKVALHVEPGFKLTRDVLDLEASSHIELKAKEHKEINNSLTYEQVIHELEKLRVIQGFNQKGIMNAVNTQEAGSFEIASGVPPKQGKDGWVEPLVDTAAKQILKEDGNGNVDFRESRTIPAVNTGNVIAIIHPPVPGKSGVTVTNEPLPAKQTAPVQLKLGKGVMTMDDKIVATDSGRPAIEKRGRLVKVLIMPKLIHQGDVDLASGNIRFIGDVEVLGDVKEGMTVEAKGDIHTHKTVDFSTLTASGAIVVRGNVVSSELSAGKNNMLVAELGHMLGILYQQTERMCSVIKQLIHSPAFKQTDFDSKGLQPLIKILLEKKFKGFSSLTKQYVEIAKKSEEYLDQPEWAEIAVLLNQIFLSLSKHMISYSIIEDLSGKIRKMYELSQTSVEPDSYITLSSVLNSQLYSSGDITIIGKGCINSKVHAGGRLNITRIVRGGELYAKFGIEINEAGAESGTATFISVPFDQSIRINKAMEGTVIKIGNIKYVLKDTTYNIHARLNKDNKLLLS